MRFIFSTGSLWSYSVERCISFASQAGFDGLELMVDHRWETRQVDFLLRLIDQFQLPIVAAHSPFSPGVPGWPDDQPGRITKTVELAEAVGARVVVHHLPQRIGFAWVSLPGRRFPVPTPKNSDAIYRRWLEDDYNEFASGTEVRLCIENMPAYRRFGRRWNYCYWNTPKQIIRFPNLTLDTTHLGTWGLEPVEIYPQLDGRVAHIHLSNFDGREHLRPETGKLRLHRFLSLLASDGYQGAISLELFPEALDAGGNDEAIVERMAASLEYCRHWCQVQRGES